MDLKGGAELTKGLAGVSLGGVIVTGSIVTEGASSMQTSWIGDEDLALLTSGESKGSNSTAQSRLVLEGELGDPVDFLATFFDVGVSIFPLTRSRLETSVRSRIRSDVEFEGEDEDDSENVTCTKHDDFSVIMGVSKMVLSHCTLSCSSTVTWANRMLLWSSDCRKQAHPTGSGHESERRKNIRSKECPPSVAISEPSYDEFAESNQI